MKVVVTIDIPDPPHADMPDFCSDLKDSVWDYATRFGLRSGGFAVVVEEEY